MFRTLTVVGLMAATMLSGIAPAYAQERGREPRVEGSGRPDRGGWRGGPRSDVSGAERGWRGGDRSGRAPTSDQAQRRWSGGDGERGGGGWGQRGGDPSRQPRPEMSAQLPARAVDQPGRDGRMNERPGSQDQWRQGRDRERRDWAAQQQDQRRDWRDDRRDDRRDWRDDRRGDWRDNDRRGWNGDDRSDGRWNNSGWNGRDRIVGRRLDDRARWADQRRWDSGWRQDRRYDWRGYRNSYGDRYRIGRYYAPRGWAYGYQRFSIGIYLNSLLYGNNYWLDDPYSYRLPPAYGSLRWIRYYDDALLVDVRDGYVVDVINDFFW